MEKKGAEFLVLSKEKLGSHFLKARELAPKAACFPPVKPHKSFAPPVKSTKIVTSSSRMPLSEDEQAKKKRKKEIISKEGVRSSMVAPTVLTKVVVPREVATLKEEKVVTPKKVATLKEAKVVAPKEVATLVEAEAATMEEVVAVVEKDSAKRLL